MSSPIQEIKLEKKEFPAKLLNFGIAALILGAIFLIAGYYFDHVRAAFNNVILLMLLISVGLGSLFIIGIEYLGGAVWSTVFRRFPEFLGSVLLIVPLFAIPIYFNLHGLYHWTHEEVVASDAILKSKSPYLNIPFFTIRIIFYFVIWIIFYSILKRNSKKQDISKDQKLTKINIRTSAIMMPFYAISVTFVAIDFLMSLEPHWFSTIIGVYYFAGTILAGLASATFLIVYFNEKGLIIKGITSDHYYSLGTLLFAFTNFWAYIAFSQFLLIWYANLPEETVWYLQRSEGNWLLISAFLVLVKFIIPYFYLLSQPSKTNPKKLLKASALILFAHFVDLFWIVMPTFSGKEVPLSWIELSVPLLTTGIVIIIFYINYKRNNIIPVGDPKLKQSLDFRL